VRVPVQEEPCDNGVKGGSSHFVFHDGRGCAGAGTFAAKNEREKRGKGTWIRRLRANVRPGRKEKIGPFFLTARRRAQTAFSAGGGREKGETTKAMTFGRK